MKKILILSYYYPPANFVGAERIASFVRHLHKFGYYPIIVTRNWNENQTNTYEEILDNSFKHRVFETHEEYYLPYNRSWRDKLFGKSCFFCTLLRRILNFIELVVSSVWMPALPYANLYTQARKLFNEQKDIEALIISGSPFESFHFGYELKKEFPHIHWIPDYRDEWTAFSRYPRKGIFEKIIFSLNAKFEKKYTSNASCFISVSDYWVEKIGNHIHKKGYSIRNGFEPRAFEKREDNLDNSKLTLAYIGSIYPNQDFYPIAKVLSKLIVEFKRHIAVEFNFYGVQDGADSGVLISHPFEKFNVKYNIFPRVSSEVLNEKLLLSDILFVTKYGDLDGFIPVKVFDYYNLYKPILHFPSDKREIENFILSTNSGWAFTNEEDCYNLLSELVHRKIKGEDLFKLVKRKDASFYSREHQASILAHHLNEIISPSLEFSDENISQSHRMKILILSYDFPPYVSIGGLRPYNWYKHFREYGLYPIVVTRQWQNKHKNHFDYISKSQSNNTIIEETTYGTIVSTSYSPNIGNRLMLRYGDTKFVFIRRLISLYYEVFQFIFPIGAKKNLFIEADKYLKDNKVDFILATGEPFVLFHYANKLSEKYNIPWIADYRDPWSLNTENFVSPLIKLWFDFQEKKLLKKMNHIITVSDYMAKKIDYFNSNKVPIEIIPNGYDSDSIEGIKYIAQNDDRLTLSFAGMIYPYHPYHDFLKTLEDFSLANSNFQFNLNFYGVNIENDLKLLINKEFPRMKESTKFFPKLPNQKLLTELARSNVLILFNDYSFLGTKIYDYLGVNRLILLCFTNDENALKLKKQYFPMADEAKFSNQLQQDLIQYTNSGIAVKDTEELKRIFNDLHNKFVNERMIRIESVHTELYSRKYQSEKLAKVILKEIKKLGINFT